MRNSRPLVITLLIVLFMVGTAASLISIISLTFPGSFLDPVWRLNPHAREGFARMGDWSVVLMLSVFIACLLAAIGLWRRRRWGYWLATVMLIVNLVGDVIHVIADTAPQAIVGIPIASLLLIYLVRKPTRNYFARSK